MITNRLQLALVGAAGALCLWAFGDAVARDLIGQRLGEVLVALTGTMAFATLAMAGPIGLFRAAVRGLALGVGTALLVWMAGLRFEEGLVASDLAALALVVVVTLPLPFLITGALGNWRDYPGLFLQAWSIVVRFATAWAFVGLVWLVLFLSDATLQVAGVQVIDWLIAQPPVPYAVTGAVLGFGLAVVQDHAAFLSPYLLLRMFRLLLPAVLLVMAVFLAALPFSGLSGLAAGLSPAFLLLAMVATGISLVSIAVDQAEADQDTGPILTRSTQAMALLLPVLAGLAVWALGQRVLQHGWTPERLFVALVAGVGLAYGLVYALAIVRGAGWQERIRQGNIGLALMTLALAALWLTPILNAEAIAARSQLARFDAGKTSAADLDLRALEGWGKPGLAVLAELQQRSEEPGGEALAARFAQAEGQGDSGPDAAAVATLIPVQPPGATGMRALLLEAAPPYLRADWAQRCSQGIGETEPPCVMVVADLLPDRPGEEAMLGLVGGDGYAELIGLFLADDGTLATRAVSGVSGGFVPSDRAAALVREWQTSPPPQTAARVNQLGTGDGGVLFLP